MHCNSAALVCVLLPQQACLGFCSKPGVTAPCEVLHTANNVIGSLTRPVGSSLSSPTGQAVDRCCRVAAGAHVLPTASGTGHLTVLRRWRSVWLWLAVKPAGELVEGPQHYLCTPCVATRTLHWCYMHVCVAGMVGGRMSVVFPTMLQGSTWLCWVLRLHDLRC